MSKRFKVGKRYEASDGAIWECTVSDKTVAFKCKSKFGKLDRWNPKKYFHEYEYIIIPDSDSIVTIASNSEIKEANTPGIKKVVFEKKECSMCSKCKHSFEPIDGVGDDEIYYKDIVGNFHTIACVSDDIVTVKTNSDKECFCSSIYNTYLPSERFKSIFELLEAYSKYWNIYIFYDKKTFKQWLHNQTR